MTTVASPVIRSINNGILYLSATSRGVQYCLMPLGKAWFVSSQRLALGRHHIGGGKHYATLADVAAGCKAFGDLEALRAHVYGVPA